MYKCQLCDSETELKFNFNRHINRKKPCNSVKKSCENVTNPCQNVTKVCRNVTNYCPNVAEDCQNVTKRCRNVTLFKCEKCEKKLSSKRNLENHQLICNGVETLGCPICKQVFENRNFRKCKIEGSGDAI